MKGRRRRISPYWFLAAGSAIVAAAVFLVWMVPIHHARREALEGLDTSAGSPLWRLPVYERVEIPAVQAPAKVFDFDATDFVLPISYRAELRVWGHFRSPDGKTSVGLPDLVALRVGDDPDEDPRAAVVRALSDLDDDPLALRRRVLEATPESISNSYSRSEMQLARRLLEHKASEVQIDSDDARIYVWESGTHEGIAIGTDSLMRVYCRMIGARVELVYVVSDRGGKAVERARELFSLLKDPSI